MICTQCKKDKATEDFSVRAAMKSGRRSECKACQSSYRKKYYQTSDELDMANQAYKENPEKFQKLRSERYLANQEGCREIARRSYQKNQKKCIERTKRWRLAHPELVKIYNKRSQEKMIADRGSRYIAHLMRCRLGSAMRSAGLKKSVSLTKSLGCTWDFFKSHVESSFYHNHDGTQMSWDNYGMWHVDHIKPLSSFDLKDPQEVAKACHFSNLQPLWAKHNQEKWAHLDWEKPSCRS